MTTPAIADLTGGYAIDTTHTRLGFTARHAMVTKVRGEFADLEGSADLDAVNPEKSTAKVVFQIASISTGQAQRDEHLRNNDFFDAAAFPTGEFNSTSVSKTGPDTFSMVGDLTLKGITKAVTIEWEHTGTAKDPFGNLRAGFEGKATINRKDWGITYNAALETGGLLVSEKINLEFDVSAVRAA